MTAIIFHLYYQDLWEEFKEKIIPILDDSVHLFVTVNYESEITEDIRLYAKEIYLLDNKGMDFGPFLNVYNTIKNEKYEYIIKLHTKKSKHNKELGDVWREKLTEVFFYNKESFDLIIETMNSNPEIYMTGAYSCFYDRIKEPLTGASLIENKETIKNINSFLNVSTHGCFFAGSIFMVSKKYLDMLFKNVILEDFILEFNHDYSPGVSSAHAMERLIGYGVEYYGGKFLTLN